MKTVDELNKELEARYCILNKAIDFYSYCKYLNQPGNKEFKGMADAHVFIKKARFACWVVAVLEINKLFGIKESYGFMKLVNKLRQDHKKAEWNNYISLEKLDEVADVLDKINTEKIKGLRDEYYAHSDRNPNKTIEEYTPTFAEFEVLVKSGQKILQALSQAHLVFEMPVKQGNVTNILSVLSVYNQLK